MDKNSRDPVHCWLVWGKAFQATAKYLDRKSTRLNSSHGYISYAVFCLKKKTLTKSSNSKPAYAKGLIRLSRCISDSALSSFLFVLLLLVVFAQLLGYLFLNLRHPHAV